MSYRVVPFPLSKDQICKASTEVLIEELNSRFDSSDLSIVKSDDRYEVHLRQATVSYVETVVKDLQNDNRHDTTILSSFLSTIKEQSSYGLRGDKRVYVDYNAERKIEGRKEKEARRGRHFYTNGALFDDKAHALPEPYIDQILCGDSENVLRQLPNNCIDLIFTSPPYNFGLGYDAQEDSTQWQNYFEKLFAILDECIRVLKYGGRLAINIQPLYSDYIPSHHMISQKLMESKLIWKGEILWEKNNYNCKYTAWGSWKSPSNPYLKYTWEFIEVFCKGTLQKAGNRVDADISADDFKKWVVGKWSIAPEKNMKAYDHPAVFPEELARRVIQLFSFRGDTVLDPFVGVGTTCVVAKKLGRGFLGVDNSAKYCETARSRLQEQMPI
ncbi:MAG: site-specific DNA-methyltransferase [Gammaproteobacteria bacterium]|nr:site-specific DNA-methyltransferase [Gammaproteobacteria bacterium]MYC25859.1 site-specific DNA-methyltransferase [Gammaproteobacteria bacterium]